MKRLLAMILVTGFLIQVSESTAGPTGYDFLRTHVGARPSALGGAFLAMTGDVHSIYYNPAALATLSSRQLTFSYLNYFLDFQSGFVAYGFQLSGIGHFGVGSHYLNYGEFKRADELGNENGTFGAGSLVLMTDYATQLAPDFYIGGALKFIHATIAEYNSSAVAGDFGLLYQFPAQRLNIGFGVFNAGTVTDAFVKSKDDLPVNYRLGVSKQLAHLPLLLCVESYKYRDDDYQFIVGGEFTLMPYLFLRLSYNSIGREQKSGQTGDADRYAGIAIGLGVTMEKAAIFQQKFWSRLSFDYSYTSAGAVGSLNRVSLGVNF